MPIAEEPETIYPLPTRLERGQRFVRIALAIIEQDEDPLPYLRAALELTRPPARDKKIA